MRTGRQARLVVVERSLATGREGGELELDFSLFRLDPQPPTLLSPSTRLNHVCPAQSGGHHIIGQSFESQSVRR